MNVLDNIKSPEELLKFMDKIVYGFVGKNGKTYVDPFSNEWSNDWYNECIIQTGEEVINSLIGTCWDQVELERLWFEKNNYNFKTIFEWYEVGKPLNISTHTYLIYEKDNKWYWFEHAFETYRGIHEFNSEEDAINFVKEKHSEHELKNNSVFKEAYKNTLTLYEYGKPAPHLGVDDFYDFVTSKQYTK